MTSEPEAEKTELHPRFEQFAWCMARGMTARAAAIQAGWAETGAHAAGYRAQRRPEVIKRIREIRLSLETERDRAVREYELPTRKKVLEDLVSVCDVAKKQQNLTAHLRALELIGKELGMFVQRSEVRVENPLASLSAEGLLQLAALLEQPEGPELLELEAEEIPEQPELEAAEAESWL